MTFTVKHIKYLRIFTLASALLFTGTNSAYAYSPEKKERAEALSLGGRQSLDHDYIVDVARRIEAMKHDPDGAAKVSSGVSFPRDDVTGTPIFMGREAVESLAANAPKLAAGTSPAEIALSFIEANADIFRLESPREELLVASVVDGAGGNTHVAFDQTYRGLPVSGHRIVVHIDDAEAVYAVNGRYSPTPGDIDVDNPIVSKDRAVEIAGEDISVDVMAETDFGALGALLDYKGPDAELSIRVSADTGEPRLAWHVTIRPDTRDLWHIYVDAFTGEVLEKYNATAWQTHATATGIDDFGVERTFNVALEDDGTYTLYDTQAELSTYDAKSMVLTRFHSPTIVESADNTWDDPTSVSAHANIRVVFDYYLEEHGRMGLDGDKGELPAVIHYTEDGTPMYNAFWNGQYIAFGDAEPFAAALDVVAHEMTHGVVGYTVGLEYQYQSGALNEAFADVMASMVDPDWEIAEDLPSGPFRDMSKPWLYGLPSDMSEYREMSLENDYGGVHINMSIPSRAAYLMAEVIGRDKTADIWYNVLDGLYLTPRAEFYDMRLAAIQSATDLYGEDSGEVAAVVGAFDTVGIDESTASEPAEDLPPLEGENFIAFVYESFNSNRLVIADAEAESENDFIYPTETTVYIGGSGPVTVNRNGSILMFVDYANNLRMIDLETWQENVVDDSGHWSSIELSPDGGHLAATTVYEDSTLYVLNIEDPDDSKSYHLYSPSTEGVKSQTVLYADALDWNSDGTQILFDCFNSFPIAGEDPLEYWDMNILDIDSGIITRIKTPTENDTQVGNPSFAETNDRYIVCDLFSEELLTSSIVTIDLDTLDIVEIVDSGMVYDEYPNLGHPHYSPDDLQVVFHQYSERERQYVLYKIPLQGDKMTASGEEVPFSYGTMPVWFVKGEEDIPTNVGEDIPPEAFTLSRNYPNPFNPVTTISYTVTGSGHVTLTVFDILGRKVDTLVDGYSPAGTYTARFDGSGLASGVYFYRLRVGNAEQTRRMMLMK